MGGESEMSSIPKGYKKTDVGEIPDDWAVKKLGEIADIISGGTPKTTEKSFWNGAILWCTPTDITRTSGRYIESTEKTITDNGLKNSSAILLPINSLLLCSRATVGDVRIAKHEITTNQGFKSLVCNSSAYYLFIYYLIPFLKPKMLEKSYGSTFLEISKSNLASIQIQLPSYVEQQAIAEVLSDMDALIEAQKELIAKKRDIKQGTMQELLSGRVRLPGYETKGWKHTDIGDIPDDWVVRELGDICEKIIGGGTPSRNNKIYWNGKIPWATVKDLSSFNFNSTQEYITEEGLRESSSTLIPAGTIILATRMLIGKPVIYNCSVAINQDLKALFLIKDYDKYYLLYYLNMKSNELIAASSGSTVLGLSIQDLKTINLISPSLLSEQQAIARVLSDMDDELETLEAELEKLNHMKRGMMQELLTGRIRLI
ncbi:hypothetical protein CXU17_05815 [Akkermansia muciniphila]|nr:hypothetical protein CXU17_05815 [Akkermansia muciniphila]